VFTRLRIKFILLEIAIVEGKLNEKYEKCEVWQYMNYINEK